MIRTLVANHNNMANREIQDKGDGDQAFYIGGLPRVVILDFPHFGGDNPSSWILKVTQYLELHQIAPTHCLLMASYQMENEALGTRMHVNQGNLRIGKLLSRPCYSNLAPLHTNRMIQ